MMLHSPIYPRAFLRCTHLRLGPNNSVTTILAVLFSAQTLMCRSKKATVASTPKLRPSPRSATTGYRSSTTSTTSSSSATFNSHSFSSESRSLLRDSLRDPAILYPFPELSAATHNLLSPRCSLRGVPAFLLHRRLRSDPSAVPAVLSALCLSHHTSLARLLGASVPGDGRIYLVYEYIPGATLAQCLRSPHNPNFTSISSWSKRMQIAVDLAQGLEYIHHHSASGNIHNHITSSSVIVTEPNFHAKICHYGAAELAGEETRIEGTRGYIAPEVLSGGRVSQKSDVYAFGVLMLELLSGEEPVRYRVDGRKIEIVSLVETAREAAGEVEGEEIGGRVRRWVDGRLRDSYPVEVAEKMLRVALRCVVKEAAERPDMVWVAGKVSRLFLDSGAWEERLGAVPDFSVSLAPR